LSNLTSGTNYVTITGLSNVKLSNNTVQTININISTVSTPLLQRVVFTIGEINSTSFTITEKTTPVGSEGQIILNVNGLIIDNSAIFLASLVGVGNSATPPYI